MSVSNIAHLYTLAAGTAAPALPEPAPTVTLTTTTPNLNGGWVDGGWVQGGILAAGGFTVTPNSSGEATNLPVVFDTPASVMPQFISTWGISHITPRVELDSIQAQILLERKTLDRLQEVLKEAIAQRDELYKVIAEAKQQLAGLLEDVEGQFETRQV